MLGIEDATVIQRNKIPWLQLKFSEGKGSIPREDNVRSAVTGEVQGIVGEYGTQFRLGLSGQEARHRGSGAQDER